MSVQVEKVQQRCRETAGFLFSHPCRNPAASTCQRCGKPVCEGHSRSLDGQATCVGCERRAVQEGDQGRLLAERRDDPYFYAWSACHDYDAGEGYTEEDRAAFAPGASDLGDDGWEADWDAS